MSFWFLLEYGKVKKRGRKFQGLLVFGKKRRRVLGTVSSENQRDFLLELRKLRKGSENWKRKGTRCEPREERES